MERSLQRILDGLNIEIRRQEFKKLDLPPPVDLPTITFADYLSDNPPVLTVREKIWYNYLLMILKGAAILLRGTVAGNAIELISLIKGEEKVNPSQINIFTNVIGFLMVLLEPLRSYFATQPFQWSTFVLCVLGAIVAYFTGKSGLKIQANNPNLKG